MSRSLTSGQKDAAYRRDVYGVIYAITGTLRSTVSGIPDAPFYWSTKELASGGPIAGYSDGWEPYISLPKQISSDLPLTLGQVPPLHVVNILVKNLPFQHTESLLTAIADGVWDWEGTEASLYAAYQKRGQTAAEIPQGDWFTVRRAGQFSGPKNIGSDGFTLPLVSREIVRRQTVKVREITSGDFPRADPREYGKVLATCYGFPDSWIRCRRVDAGNFAYTSQAVVSGTSDTLWVTDPAGSTNWDEMVGETFYVHRADKTATVTQVGAWQGVGGTKFTLKFSSTFNYNIPAGALVQQKITSGYRFAALNQWCDGNYRENVQAVALETLDGRIVPMDGLSYDLDLVLDPKGKGRIADAHGYSTGLARFDIVIDDSQQPPALIPRLNLPSDSVEVTQQPAFSVTQQPAFSTSQKLEGTKDTWPSGPLLYSAAFDGNESTGYSVTGDTAITFNFPSYPGGNFADSDTIRSTLHFITQGIFQITDGGATEFYPATNPNKNTYHIVLGSPENFNQDVKFIAGPAGGIVYEVWWTHDLQTEIELTRDEDVIGTNTDVVVESTGEAGYDMVGIKGVLLSINCAGTNNESKAYPGTIFKDLQERFLGEPRAGAPGSDWWNQSAYTTANARWDANTIALHFIIDRQFSWPELEADIALASRSYAFYGAEGHEVIFIEDDASLESVTPAAEFRLPGVPNPNTTQSAGSPLMERTSLADLVNTVRVYFTRNWLLDRTTDLEERFDSFEQASNAESVAIHGEKRDSNGAIESWPQSFGAGWTNIAGGTHWYNWNGTDQARRLAQFLANRYSKGHTRFAFDTGGEVAGVTRGDVVRVTFASAPGVYRNVLCEVESVRVTPLDVHKFSLVCRSLQTPQKGLTSALIWTDLYTGTDDTWAEKITGIYDRWDQYWRAS